MATPTEATDNVAHAAIALAVAIIVPMVTRKGHGRSIISGIASSVLHMMLDGPLAQAMADHGLQL
jgi:ABC-type proline/glycine betaine transport system permease subunit